MAQALNDLSCGCPPESHPPVPAIPAGLSTLPRQLVGFDEYRNAMLSRLGESPALKDWRGRARFDLGMMLIDWWSYVLDVTAFYDERIANRSYLQTSPDVETTVDIVSLLGHRPRPAMGAAVSLAVTALGDDPVTIAAGAAFRSDGFGDNPPQIFELDDDVTIWPQRNRWTLGPVRTAAFDGTNIWLTARRAPHVGATVMLSSESGQRVAARVADVRSTPAADGSRYLRVIVRDQDVASVASLAGAAQISLSLMRVALGPSPYVANRTGSVSELVLESVYPITEPHVVFEIDGALTVRTVTAVETEMVQVATVPGTTDPVLAPATKLVFDSAFSVATSAQIRVHASALPLGELTQPAKTRIDLDDLTTSGPGAALQDAVAPLHDAPAAAEVIATGKGDHAFLIDGTITGDGAPGARLVVGAATSDFTTPLTAPVTLFGNVIEVTRGVTEFDELLGTGDATAQFLTLPLAQQPLTWLEDHSNADGRSAELVVRVDGIEWARVDSFFDAGPTDRVYRTVLDAAGETSIEFGGDGFGLVPATGAEIRADYRHGAGAATPPPGSITKTASPIEGLDVVTTSLAARGGADAETIDDLKTSAPAAMLSLGRAVSIVDFEGLARSYANVLNASAGWDWHAGRQRAGVKVWIIPAAGDPSTDLAAWLRSLAVPDLNIAVVGATALDPTLVINLDVLPEYDRSQVVTEVRNALFADTDGLLSAANVTIGGPVFRSVITERVHQVAGVRSITSILLDSTPMPTGIDPGPGNWFDLAEKAQVQ